MTTPVTILQFLCCLGNSFSPVWGSRSSVIHSWSLCVSPIPNWQFILTLYFLLAYPIKALSHQRSGFNILRMISISACWHKQNYLQTLECCFASQFVCFCFPLLLVHQSVVTLEDGARTSPVSNGKVCIWDFFSPFRGLEENSWLPAIVVHTEPQREENKVCLSFCLLAAWFQ